MGAAAASAAAPRANIAVAPTGNFGVFTRHEAAAVEGGGEPDSARAAAVMENVPAAGAAVEGIPESESVNVWPDDTAEAAFMAEARGRGESVKAAPAVVEEIEDRESAKALPKLSELVERIPVETREVLEELFRAKFVAVRRVKKSDLKQ